MKKGLRLYKDEKLCNEVAIGALFDRGSAGVGSKLAYPLRMVWRVAPDDEPRRGSCARFLVSVPKKRLRHAVDRVTVRRRVREQYRLNRHLIPEGVPFEIAFIYVADEVLPTARILPAMQRLLAKLRVEG
ncbi:MAG: ribonuclease P protein component [Duncaniella sp.]|nr:ribonuclease P protein component [Duncaniella sp.]MDE5734687.1 ribonuclease P protein component [Duncaniella sp.]